MTNEAIDPLGYDPFDMNSLPYGLRSDDLRLDIRTLESIDTLDFRKYMMALVNDPNLDGGPGFRVLDVALRLFKKLTSQPGNYYDGLAYADIFTACLDTALIWEAD